MTDKNGKISAKLYVTVFCSACLLLLYVFIFSFSDQDGETSGSLSALVAEKCVAFLHSLTGGNWSEVMRTELALYFENPIRKMAHFAEYAVMGVLLTVLWAQWLKRGVRFYLLVILWVFISAAADEIHQLFVPGRHGCFADVLLDTFGGIFGMMLVRLICKMWNQKRGRYELKHSNL